MEKIDYHVHIGYDEFRTKFNISEEEVISRMEQYGIDKSVIFACPNVYPKKENPYLIENKKIFQISEKHGNLIPFMFVHPHRDNLEMILENELLFKGYKIYCNAAEMDYSYETIHDCEVMKYLSKRDKPFIFHIGKDKGHGVENLSKFVSNTDSPIILAHVGRFKKESLKNAAKFPNTFVDITPLKVLIENPYHVSKEFKFTEDITENYKIIADFLIPLFDKRLLWGTEGPWIDNFIQDGFKGENEVFDFFKPYLGNLNL